MSNDYLREHKKEYNKKLRDTIKKYGAPTMNDAFVKLNPSNMVAQRMTRFEYESTPFYTNMLPNTLNKKPPLAGDAAHPKLIDPTQFHGVPRFHRRTAPRPEMSYEELLRQTQNRHVT